METTLSDWAATAEMPAAARARDDTRAMVVVVFFFLGLGIDSTAEEENDRL